MKIPYLPPSVKRNYSTVRDRVNALQEAVNGWLHSINICPVATYWAGPKAYRVKVIYDRGYYYLDQTFGNDNFNLKGIWEKVYRRLDF